MVTNLDLLFSFWWLSANFLSIIILILGLRVYAS